MKKQLCALLIFNCYAIADVHETLQSLTLEQKIGQLFFASCIIDQHENAALVTAKNYPTDVQTVKQLIEKHHIGGVIFLGLGTPEQQIQTMREFNALAKTPLFYAQDFERGLSQRLFNTIRFPYAMTLGALNNEQLLYALGAEIARQCKIMGVHINLAPVCDVNNNEKNPIINDRSFGDNPADVARLAIAYMRGLQDNGIIACAKHFPGHGDVTKDSHDELPKVAHARERLDAIELHPFQKIIAAGVRMVMSAFLEVPALESQSHRPAALSHAIVTKLLKHELGFQGLVITDGLDMKGVINCGDAANIAVHAFLAGNDILICSKNIPASIAQIKELIENGIISIDELNARVAKIMCSKEWAFAQHARNADFGDIKKLWNTDALQLKKQLFSHSITRVRDPHNVLPFKEHTISLITFSNTENQSAFSQSLRAHLQLKELVITPSTTQEEIDRAIASIDNEIVVVSLLHMQRLGSLQFDAKAQDKKLVHDFGISAQTIQVLAQLRAAGKKLVLIVFGNPYSLKFFDKNDTIIVAYENDTNSQEAAAEIACGKMQALGKLPVTVARN